MQAVLSSRRLVICVLVVSGAFGGGSVAARGDAAEGELGSGGSAVGDISKEPDETDRIGIDLAVGATLSVKLTSDFPSQLDLLGPDEASIAPDLATGPSTRMRLRWSASASGRHHLRVRSADGSQGGYRLAAKVKWPTKLSLTGRSDVAVEFGLLAGATLKGEVVATGEPSWDPTILSLAPLGGGSLLDSPVVGVNGTARLPRLTVPATGSYTLTVGAGEPGVSYEASFSAKLPQIPPARIDLRNGLTQVSYEQDGVDVLMRSYSCVDCHDWATTYAGVRAYARLALPRLASGQMPKGRRRMSVADLSVFRAWMATGMNR